ncbi:MAG: hypothetical protein Q9227_007156 [Pyrenula ochraceoflavens]
MAESAKRNHSPDCQTRKKSRKVVPQNVHALDCSDRQRALTPSAASLNKAPSTLKRKSSMPSSTDLIETGRFIDAVSCHKEPQLPDDRCVNALQNGCKDNFQGNDNCRIERLLSFHSREDNIPSMPITPRATPQSIPSILARRRRHRLTRSRSTQKSIKDRVADFMANLYAELDDACYMYNELANPKWYCHSALDIIIGARACAIHSSASNEDVESRVRSTLKSNTHKSNQQRRITRRGADSTNGLPFHENNQQSVGNINRKLRSLSVRGDGIPASPASLASDLKTNSTLKDAEGMFLAPRYRKAARFAAETDWITLTICAHSTIFTSEFLRYTSSRFDKFQTEIDTCLKKNKFSISMYAHTRRLAFQKILSRSTTQLSMLPLPSILRQDQTKSISQAKKLHQSNLALPPGAKHPHEVHLHNKGQTVQNTVDFPAPNEALPGELIRKLNQVDISRYKHTFPNDPLWAGRKTWPIDNPLFRTSNHLEEQGCGGSCNVAKCYVCLDTLSPNLSRKVPDSHPSAFCDCTLDDIDPALRARGLHHSLSKPRPTPLLEMYLPSSGLGVGVRALQNIRRGAYLGLYLGEIYPLSPPDTNIPFPTTHNPHLGSLYGLYRNNTYHLAILGKQPAGYPPHPRSSSSSSPSSSSSSKPKETTTIPPVLGIIDAALHGNWTRYMNHSCSPNTIFCTRPVGKLVVTTVEALREIRWGEEMTVDYGEEYFVKGGRDCRCGEEGCRLWRAGRVGRRSGVSWGEWVGRSGRKGQEEEE